MQQIETEKVPIFNWATELEEGALEQAKNLARLPFVHNHVALMPDCHQGYGMPIGGVLATKDVIIPNAVGVDIGCFEGNTKIPLLNGTKRTLHLAEEKKKLEDQGIIHSVRNNNDLDEAPGSYKDIDVVMENQKDLINIVTKLRPLGVIKG